MTDDELDLYNLLLEWRLSHLFSYMRGNTNILSFFYYFYLFLNLIIEECISMEVLEILNENHINKLFRNLPVGHQALFEHKLKEWKSANIPTFNQNNSRNVKKFPSLLTILQDSPTGKQIMEYYDSKQCFHEEQRVLLINTIAKYLDVKGYDITITDCLDIEKQICTVFPSEQLVRVRSLHILVNFSQNILPNFRFITQVEREASYTTKSITSNGILNLSRTSKLHR